VIVPVDTPAVIHVRRGARWRAFGLGDVWAYRGLLLNLALRDVKLRYKQTIVGIFWVVLQPLLAAGIMTVAFGYIAGVRGPEGMPYFVFAYLGQMGWTLFSLTLVRTSGSMVANSAIVMKIYFPRPVLPLSTILAALLDFAICFTLAIPMVVRYGQGVTHLPVALLSGVLLVLFATGLGFILAALSVRFRDVLFVLPFIVQLGLYASPVAYGLEVARDNLTAYSTGYFDLYMLNPLASLIEAFRWGLVGEGLFLPAYFAYGALCAVAMLVGGFALFRASEGRFADVI
jgi:lipopolysaccharide transport system permease protein